MQHSKSKLNYKKIVKKAKLEYDSEIHKQKANIVDNCGGIQILK